ncbi:MAG TPA: hypothetical protein VK536_10285 [Candidatus Limnocylindrales bacterium]|nr:hypothetical protein [Candidatus Limnocylindrales bacterium]
MKEVANKMKGKGIDTSKIPLEKVVKYYEEGRKLEWKRLSTMQTGS